MRADNTDHEPADQVADADARLQEAIGGLRVDGRPRDDARRI
jgi:hypothetical protein